MVASSSKAKTKNASDPPTTRNHRSMVLLGAGASKAAGLPDTFELTEKVYDRLQRKTPDEASLFAYVVSRLVTRSVLSGGSPFGKVNIEAAYDAVIRLLSYASDPMSDFMSGLDPNIGRYLGGIDEREFAQAFTGSVMRILNDMRQANGRSPSYFGHEFAALRSAIERPLVGQSSRSSLNHVLPFLRALIACLNHERIEAAYLAPLVRACSEYNVTITSLNYDLVVESACSLETLDYDYGLQTWNNKDLVNFSRTKLSLIKLHGSINWQGEPDNIKIASPDEIGGVCNMIFGTGEGKLKPDGPFLQLRSEFERRLANCEKLFVVGYSFGDNHLNGILRRWSRTRTDKRRGCLIDVNPSLNNLRAAGIQGSPNVSGVDRSKELFGIKNWRRNAEDTIDSIVECLPPAVSRGSVPDSV